MCSMARLKAACAHASPKNSNWLGMPKVKEAGKGESFKTREREKGSASSNPASASKTLVAVETVVANIETQSTFCAAGTTPAAETNPRDGFNPPMLLRPAGTRPDPAVSVPSAKSTSCLATT